MLQANQQIVTNGDMSGNIISAPAMLVVQMFGDAIQLVWTGTPTGTFSVQYSCDVGIDQFGDGVVNWSTHPTSILPIVATDGNWIFNCVWLNVKWVRLLYTATSGTGILNARFNLKGV